MSAWRMAAGLLIVALAPACEGRQAGDTRRSASAATKHAAAPRPRGGMPLAEALARRRSVRDFLDRPLSQERVARLAWAAQGITDPTRGFRTAPSAGALYPIELYVVTADGVSRYLPRTHAFEAVDVGDKREALAKAAVNQTWVARAPATFVVTAVYERTTKKYGQRGVRYATIEVGHVCQNISLQAFALGLGSVSVGAFHDHEVQRIIGAPKHHRPLCLVCVGYPRVAPQ